MSAIADLLAPRRSLCQLRTGSRKQLFEIIADTLATEYEEFHPTELVAGMLGREKLGSTAMGKGIALPHCRLRDCVRPIGILASLSTSLPFDAPDDLDVDLVFALVVPLEATQEHLNILAELARRFSQPAFCSALRSCDSSAVLCSTAINWVEQSA